MRNNTIKHLIDELTYKWYAKMHVNPTYMLMKPKKSMWGDLCFVVKISQKFHNIFYFNMIWKKHGKN